MAYESNLTKGAYGSPKRNVDKATQDLLKENSIQNNILQSFKDFANNVLKQKIFQRQSDAAVDKQAETLNNAMNMAGSSGFTHIDESVVNLWNGKIDDFYTIKNAMHNGDISRREGNRELQKIMAMPRKWANTVKVLATNKKLYDEAKKNGTLSSLGSIENKSILDGNQWDVSEQGGNFFFYQDGQEIDGVQMPPSVVNGNALLAADAAGQEMFQEIVDVSALETSAYNNSFTPTDIKSKYFTTDEFRNGDIIPGSKNKSNNFKGEVFTNIPKDQAYTYKIMTEEQGKQARVDLASNGSLKPILNNEEIMPSYWQDKIPDGITYNAEGEEIEQDEQADPNSLSAFYDANAAEFEANGIGKKDWVNSSWNNVGKDLSEDVQSFIKNKQMQAATNYMVEETMKNNNDVDQTLKVVSKRTIKPEENVSPQESAAIIGSDGYKALETVKFVHHIFDDPATNMHALEGKEFKGKIISEARLNDEGKIQLYADLYKEDKMYVDEETNQPLIEHEQELLMTIDPNNIGQQKYLTEYLFDASAGKSAAARSAHNQIPTMYDNYDRQEKLANTLAKANANLRTKREREVAETNRKYSKYREVNRMTPGERDQYRESLKASPEYMALYREIMDTYGGYNEVKKDDPEMYQELQKVMHDSYKKIITARQNNQNELDAAQKDKLGNLKAE